jgi:hypothetical protein
MIPDIQKVKFLVIKLVKDTPDEAQWFIPVILNTQKMEINRTKV